MARSVIGVNDPKAVKKYAATLAVDVGRESYWTRKMMGTGEKSKTPIQMLPHLESDAGEQITYDLSLQKVDQPVEGDAIMAGKEGALAWATDNVYIDQMRSGTNAGGRMTRKRTLHDLREVSRARESEWWARTFDELFFMYGSGSRGANTDYIFPSDYTGFAGNALTAPDAEHIMYGGTAVSKSSLTANDKFTLKLVDRLKTRATMMGGGTQRTPQIRPIRINGADHYCIVMSPWSEYDLRTDVTTGQWLDIQKAAAGAEGRKNPIFQGAMGMYNDVVLHSHKANIRFDDYGAGSDVSASRALFMGMQAMVCAFGSTGGGLRFDWHEETDDRGNQLIINTHSIFGVKKCTYEIDGTPKDFGMIAVDVAAADPG